MEKSILNLEIRENSKFYKTVEGENRCRIVSNFIQRAVTYKNGQQAIKYSCWVIDRKDGEVRMADFGAMVIKQLKALATGKDYAFTDLPPYDITINKQGSGMDTSYTVTPARQDTTLTEEDKTRVEKAGKLSEFINKLKGPMIVNEVAVEEGDPNYVSPDEISF